MALTPRELQVLDMTSQGLTNAEVAARLDVTVHAVKFHLSSIYRALGVSNRTSATAVYLSRPRPQPQPNALQVLEEPA
jgi:DNA-binding CsgD family transcriptional regulator